VYNSAGITDSKIPDVQAGYEKGISRVAAVLAGANYIHHAAGILESTLTVAYEQFVIDDDINGSVMRMVRGIEVNDETLSADLIDRVCQGGEGHFLGEQQTLKMMTTEYYYPHVGDWQALDKWRADGRLTITARARRKAKRILETHQPQPILPEIDAAIRERFKIFLPVELVNLE
jgi:trimethylamine--corrinoid protein Co-methyltransferase